MSGRVVAPVSELRADRHQAPDQLPGRSQARCAAAKAVTDHIDRLAGKLTLYALEHRLEVQGAQSDHDAFESFQRRGPRFADAAVVIGDDIEAVGKQVIGEARVVSAADRGSGVDDDHCPGGVLPRMSPGEAAEDETVGGSLLERISFTVAVSGVNAGLREFIWTAPAKTDRE